MEYPIQAVFIDRDGTLGGANKLMLPGDFRLFRYAQSSLDPGMLLQVAKEHKLDLQRCVVIGDRWTDMVAAYNAGCMKILVRTSAGQTDLAKYQNNEYSGDWAKSYPDYIADNIISAVIWIVLQDNQVLESDRLILRPFKLSDVEDVFLYASDDVVTRYLRWSPHKDTSETEQSLRKHFINKPGVFAITLKKDNKCIGCIELRVVIEHDKASFGYVLNREYWSKGYMTEALNLVLDLAFAKLKLNRVESTHYVGNEASGRVMAKCGMKYEGQGIQEVKIKDKYHDVVHYAILRDDWIVVAK